MRLRGRRRSSSRPLLARPRSACSGAVGHPGRMYQDTGPQQQRLTAVRNVCSVRTSVPWRSGFHTSICSGAAAWTPGRSGVHRLRRNTAEPSARRTRLRPASAAAPAGGGRCSGHVQAPPLQMNSCGCAAQALAPHRHAGQAAGGGGRRRPRLEAGLRRNLGTDLATFCSVSRAVSAPLLCCLRLLLASPSALETPAPPALLPTVGIVAA